MIRLQESAGGNIDKLYSSLQKVKAAIEKAQSAVLDVADMMDEVIVEATAIGGKVQEIVPQHINVSIDKLTKMADEELGGIIEGDQSSVNKLLELIENIPYRDIKPTSPSENREARKQMVNISPPDLSNGPQSQQLNKQQESIDLNDFYNSYTTAFDKQTKGAFTFDQIRESKVFGEEYDEDMMNFAKAAPASLGKYIKQGTQRIREKINSEVYEETDLGDPTGKLQEGFINSFRSPGIDSDLPLGAIFNQGVQSSGHVVN